MNVAPTHILVLRTCTPQLGFQSLRLCDEIDGKTGDDFMRFFPSKVIPTVHVTVFNVVQCVEVVSKVFEVSFVRAYELKISSGEPSVKERQGVGKLFALNDLSQFADNINVVVGQPRKPFPIGQAGLIFGVTIGGPEVLDHFREFIQLRVECTLERPQFSTSGKGHDLLVAFTLTLINFQRRSHRQVSGKYCEATRNQSLKVVNEVPPAISAGLARDLSRRPEKHRQTYRRRNYPSGKYEQSLLVKIRQSFPRNPNPVGINSHFSRRFGSLKGGAA